jgi:outer membrane immunogenic protein
MNRFVVASLSVASLSVGLTAAASAADLAPLRPAPGPVYTKAPGPAPLSWTGCYLGANAGGAFINNQDSAPTVGGLGSDSPTGFVGGGQVGCDYQISSWVFGVQGMFDWADVNGSHSVPGTGGFTSLSTDDKWIGTATGRIGYTVQPAILVYAKGGAAWTRDDLSASFVGGSDSATADRMGWTAGGGLEYMFMPNWSVFAEYNYMDFGSKTLNFPIAGPIDATQTIQTATVGVNWHLRPW